MEQVLNALKEEIKKIMSEEKMNTGQLIELLEVYRKIESYEMTSVNQMTSSRQFQPVFPINLPPARNETAALYDGMIKSFQQMYKAQTPNISASQITRYIDWYKFLDEIITSNNILYRDNGIDEKSREIKTLLYDRIIKDIENEIDKKTENVPVENTNIGEDKI